MSENSELQVSEGIDIKIERIVPRGLGIGFAEGMTVFVPLSAPGDTLRVNVREIKGKIAFAEIVEILAPSSFRIDPPCPHFGVCGGCDFQQMSYDFQLSAKAGIVVDSLRRVGKFDIDTVEIVGSPKEFGYRSRARWHADAIQNKIGYFRRDSHDIVDVETCPILMPDLENKLLDLRESGSLKGLLDPKAEIDAATDGTGVSLNSRALVEPLAQLRTKVAGFDFEHSADSFFQANPFLIDKLVELAVGGLEGRLALDLYCGIGLFSLPLAARFSRVIGIEDHPAAVEGANRNAEINLIDHAEFHRSKVSPFLFSHRELRPDVVVLDPPRAGVEKFTVQNILRLEPRVISYVSCEPSGLSRDLRKFVDGGYAIEKITALDLFPQTHHVETVVRLKRRSNIRV